MSGAYYLNDDVTRDVHVGAMTPMGVNKLFMDDPERMRHRFEEARKRIRAEDKKRKKLLESAQKYTKI